MLEKVKKTMRNQIVSRLDSKISKTTFFTSIGMGVPEICQPFQYDPTTIAQSSKSLALSIKGKPKASNHATH